MICNNRKRNNLKEIYLPKTKKCTTFCLLSTHKRMNSIRLQKSMLYTIFQLQHISWVWNRYLKLMLFMTEKILKSRIREFKKSNRAISFVFGDLRFKRYWYFYMFLAFFKDVFAENIYFFCHNRLVFAQLSGSFDIHLFSW